MADFFISYNSNDRQWAEWIAWTLEESGYSVVIQAWDFRPGQNFALEMNRAVSSSSRTIAVLSQSYLDATYTHPEWAAAFAADPLGAQRKLIPVRVGECKPDGLLQAAIYIDLVGRTEEEAKIALLDGMRDRAKPPARPAFPGGIVTAKFAPAFPGPSASGKSQLTDVINATPGPAETSAPRQPPPAGNGSGGDGEAAPESDSDAHSWTPVWIFSAIIGVLLALLLWQAERIAKYTLGAVVVVLYAFVGLLCAYVLFRILKSSGLLQGKAFGSTIEFGGPAAILALFVLAGFNSRGGLPFPVQFECYDEANQDRRVSADGTIEFTLDSPMRGNVNNGYAVVTGIPHKYRNDSVRISGALNGYEIVTRRVKLDSDSAVSLLVRRTGVADKQGIIGTVDTTTTPRKKTGATGTTGAAAPTTTAPTTTTPTTTTPTTTATAALEGDDHDKYLKETGALRTLANKRGSDLTDADVLEMERLTQSLVDIQKRIGTQTDWKDTYALLLEKNPAILTKLNIPKPV